MCVSGGYQVRRPKPAVVLMSLKAFPEKEMSRVREKGSFQKLVAARKDMEEQLEMNAVRSSPPEARPGSVNQQLTTVAEI